LNLPGDESKSITNKQDVIADRAPAREEREPFRWRVPRTRRSPRNQILALLFFAGGTILVCVILPSLILWGVLHFMGLDPREHRTQFVQFGVAGVLLTVCLAAFTVIAYLQDLLGTGVTVRSRCIELSNRDRSRFEWGRIRSPQIVAPPEGESVDGRAERGRLEFRYETSPGIWQEITIPIYGRVDLAVLRRFADEHCAKD